MDRTAREFDQRKSAKKLVSRLGLEPRALALKARTSPLILSVMECDELLGNPRESGDSSVMECD